ncbi:MAG TPA: hypothetical protein PK965_08235 [Anaerohalosphaeraceae bacterium]|nr:hypothetical protein [Anaerohalosphaeraceae bacterium]
MTEKTNENKPQEEPVQERQTFVERRKNVVDRRSGWDRRRGPGHRRPEERRLAEEGQMTEEQFEFLMAIDQYKRANRRPFPTWTEVLEVIKALGYRKVAEPQPLESFRKADKVASTGV